MIPRSETPAHIDADLDLLGSALDEGERAASAAMDDAEGRIGSGPGVLGVVPLPSRG